MKRHLSVIFILILIVSSLGCIETPDPPGVDIPRLIVDYDERADETIIHVSGTEATRFENMTINLNGTEEKIRTIGYSIEHRTNRSSFDLVVNATRKENRYNFNATFDVNPEVDEEEFGEDVIFKITYYDEEEEYMDKNNLPFMRILNIVEEDEEQ